MFVQAMSALHHDFSQVTQTQTSNYFALPTTQNDQHSNFTAYVMYVLFAFNICLPHLQHTNPVNYSLFLILV